MAIRYTSSFIRCTYVCILLFTILFVLLTVGACDTPPIDQSATAQSTDTPTIIPTAIPTVLPSPTPTLLPQALHGPANFLLQTPLSFSQASGTTTDNGGTVTQLTASTIQAAITSVLKRFLFVADRNDMIKVYTPGATASIATAVTQRADGSTAIDYTQVVNSVTTTFRSALLGNRMIVTYHQQYQGGPTPNDPLSMTGSDVTVAFTTYVKWIAAQDIPTAPGNAMYQLTKNGGVALSWSAGQHAHTYNIYRMIPSVNQQFQLISSVTGTSYNDTSLEAIRSSRTTTGIAYAIFSVGPTGVENPSNVTISVPS